jgi:hypothetical protein
MEAALREAPEVLEEFPRSLTPSQAEEALKPVARKAGIPRKTLTRRALEEARRWTEEVLEGFWEALGVPSPPAEVGETVREGGKVRLWCPWGREAPLGRLTVEANKRGTFTYLDLPLSGRSCPRTFILEAHAGRVEVAISPRLFARKGRALFRTRDPRGGQEDPGGGQPPPPPLRLPRPRRPRGGPGGPLEAQRRRDPARGALPPGPEENA